MNIKDLNWRDVYNGERFEHKSHFISRLRMIVRVNVVLNRTVVDSDRRFDNLCGGEVYYGSTQPSGQ